MNETTETSISILENLDVLDGLFDLHFYRISYPDTADMSEIQAFSHYLNHGIIEGRSPCAIFDCDHFNAINNIEHNLSKSMLTYLKQWRKFEIQPSLMFIPQWYRAQHKASSTLDVEPIGHYRRQGWKLGLNPHPLFDSIYYIEQNDVLIGEYGDPLTHFLLKGHKEDLKTSPHFDPFWYRERHPDINQNDIHPLIHYLRFGFLEGRAPVALLNDASWQAHRETNIIKTDILTDLFLKGGRAFDLPPSVTFDPQSGLSGRIKENPVLSRAPLVSVIVANKNGRDHLRDLFLSLKQQTYTNFEIIFVDDQSSDDSCEVAMHAGVTKILRMDRPSGFTGTNNAGLRAARGELIALLNNDTRVAEDWLYSLVNRMRRSSEIGAVTSKVLFWSKFIRISIEASDRFSIARQPFLDQLPYKKVFLRWGDENDAEYTSGVYGLGKFRVEIDVPKYDIDLHFNVSINVSRSIKTYVEQLESDFRVFQDEADSIRVFISRTDISSRNQPGGFLINNAGSEEGDNGLPRDRGFGQVDGSGYDHPEEVEYLCGCSVLIRRDALEGESLFIDELFAYFEDSELSLRLRKKGYTIWYEPSAVTFHKHSSTSVEKSAFWRRQVSRNELIFRYLRSFPDGRASLKDSLAHLNHLHHWYLNNSTDKNELAFAQAVPDMMAEIEQITRLVDAGVLPRRLSTRIGVYNPYWSTLGGGEAHALYIASVLSKRGTVELISPSDFDMDRVCAYFGLDSGIFIKRLVPNMNSNTTEDYDVFVNSCYADSMFSKAPESYYIVSFPHKTSTPSFSRSYKLWANSNFTAKWITQRWSSSKEDISVLYPVVHSAYFLPSSGGSRKLKNFLSVGRFASSGHIKNQLEIVYCFSEFCRRYERSSDWRLTLIGSVNDSEYVDKVREASKDVNVDLILNAPFTTVVEAYRMSSIYVHASGFGHDPVTHPELHEHFGMAVAQAVCSGCYPVVIDGAGPAEIVREIGFGKVFDSLEELTLCLIAAATAFDTGELARPESISEAGARFNEMQFERTLESIMSEVSRAAAAQVDSGEVAERVAL